MENLEHQASLLFGEKEYAKALEIYQLLLRDNPKNEKYAISCGNCFDALGDKEAAVAYYLEAYRTNHNSEAAALNLSTTYYELKDFDHAREYAHKVLNLNKKNIAAWQNLANIAFCNTEYEEALQYYQKMYDLNNNSYIAMINLANTYYYLGKYVMALDFAKRSMTRHPSSTTAYILAGNSLNSMGKYEKAIDMYLRAFELDNTNLEMLNSLSDAYRSNNDWENCILFAWRYIKNLAQPTNAAHLNFGYLLYECYSEKSTDLAKKYAQKWLKFFPDNKITQHLGLALTNGKAMQNSDADFIRETFNSFAPEFETTLTDLEYQAPKLIMEALEKNLKKSIFKKYHILDLGCGTGLCGQAIKPFASSRGLIGVDLSDKMLEIAEQKEVYAQLICDDICHYMENSEYFFHIMTAADVLTYFGDLTKVFVRIWRSLTPDGLFVFTFSENDFNKEDFFMAPSGRFVHSYSYVEKVLKSVGFKIISAEKHILRNEAEIPVYGYVIVARKPDLSKSQ
ncbi:MAG: methyltransferase domain-containing protein [Alphaproteobacteria bacterium]|nr:methyltransferase domain-containing protein [Alphaproteobacteria bacterium]